MRSTGTVLIDGVWESRSAQKEVFDPSDGSSIGFIDFPTGEDALKDVTRAADAAQAAFKSWADKPAKDRANILLKGAQLIEERIDELSVLLAREAGKRLPEARGEIAFSVEYFRWFGEEARRTGGHVLPHEAASKRHIVMRKATGVVASLTPWNFPCSIQARKLAPALAAGCTVVARVSEKAPLAATEMIRCLTDAGLPNGVINLVHGPSRETTRALLEHPAVRIVTFTGSTEVGRSIMSTASTRIVRPLLELGGDAPFIVLDDADLELAVEGALLGKFRNTGQSCVGANRFFVQDGIYDAFVARLVERVNAMSIGSGLQTPVPDLGPVIDQDRKAAVEALVSEAVAAGAKVLTAERELPETGTYVAPVLLADVPNHVGLATSEVFGPVAAIFRVEDEAEAISLANNTEMGLAGYVWSENIRRCWKVAEELEVGIVGINEALPSAAFAPMGGVKQSGLGREGSNIGIEEFTDLKYAAMSL